MQIHLGGGTPTFLSPKQLERLFSSLNKNFSIATDADISIEIDPRVTSLAHLETLSQLGINRVSLGVQDFNEKVQKAIHRIQTYPLVAKLVDECRNFGFSINFDLIYGLPFQTMSSIEETLKKVLTLSPDRIAFYRLAMIPDMFKWQRTFWKKDLPPKDKILDIYLLIINTLTQNGYSFIGLDHFAKENDALSKALQEKSVRRNFQGMSTDRGLDIIGLGPSSISQFEDGYIQNVIKTKDWHLQVKETNPSLKGITLDQDDQIRKEVIESLYCYGAIHKTSFKQKWNIDFDDYFLDLKKDLDILIRDRLVVNTTNHSLSLTRILGRLLVRAVASVFDKYLLQGQDNKKTLPTFSQLG